MEKKYTETFAFRLTAQDRKTIAELARIMERSEGDALRLAARLALAVAIKTTNQPSQAPQPATP